LVWQLLLAGPLAAVGLLTLRAGWLAAGARFVPAGRSAAPGHRVALRAAGVATAAAGGVAVLGALAAAVQPTLPAMLTVAAIAWAGALGLAVAARRLTARTAPDARTGTRPATPAPPAAGRCASCPLTCGPDRERCAAHASP